MTVYEVGITHVGNFSYDKELTKRFDNKVDAIEYANKLMIEEERLIEKRKKMFKFNKGAFDDYFFDVSIRINHGQFERQILRGEKR